jgi:anthranilate 1,2-dioxygenase small subunit
MSAHATSAVPAATTDRLLTRVRVEEVLSAYERCIDDDDLESWPDFFTEDATYAIYPRENWEDGFPIPLLLCHGKNMMHDRVLSRREANIYAPHVYRHFHSSLAVTTGEDGIHAVSNYVVIQTLQDGEGEIYQAGRTFDHLVEGPEGALLMAARTVVYDTNRVGTLLVTPI